MSRIVAALATALALLVLPAAATAARDLQIGIMDDQLILFDDNERINGAMTVFTENLGADFVRVSAFWRDIAPAAEAQDKPAGFQAHDPNAPGYDWTVLDKVVQTAHARGLKVLISITTPAPIWASASPSRENPVWKIRPVEFARFAQAVATRYEPYADMYAIGNEPNQGAWLQPQADSKGLYAPHLYRRWVDGSYPRIKKADPTSTVLIGELASSGRDDRGATRPIRPLEFLREMACRDDDYDRKRRGRCDDFEAVEADAIGHHPYKFAGRPDRRSRERDDAAIGDWRRLRSTVDQLTRRKGLRPQQGRRFDFWYTEFGYQTDPPDPISGISLARQDDYLQQAFHYAWRTPRVRGMVQFRLTDGELTDAEGPARFSEFQSGLLFEDGKPKTAYHNFMDPFWISETKPDEGDGITLWGQVRPGVNHRVAVQYRSRPSRDWKTLFTRETDENGYWERRIEGRTGQFRFTWSDGRSTARTVHVQD
ncbi:MAG: cellulase family glycosylhydrolase [Thermoleophilaceae bacterium]